MFSTFSLVLFLVTAGVFFYGGFVSLRRNDIDQMLVNFSFGVLWIMLFIANAEMNEMREYIRNLEDVIRNSK